MKMCKNITNQDLQKALGNIGALEKSVIFPYNMHLWDRWGEGGGVSDCFGGLIIIKRNSR